jgi:3',5'-cyclic AMP phosphodiesterase CpdA
MPISSRNWPASAPSFTGSDLSGMQDHFAHISDPHMTTLEGAGGRQLLNKRLLGYLSWRRKRRYQHRRDILTALQHDLQVRPVEQLLVTGDLTHIGLPEEFAQARAWLQQLGDPHQIAVVPGNHDALIKGSWQDTFAHWEDYMASDEPVTPWFPSLRVRGAVAYIGLSSACPTPPFMATGTVGKAQLERLPRLLQATRKQGLFRVLYLHHSPLAGTEKWRKRLTDATALEALIEAQGAELVLHGHGHRAHYRELETRHGMVPVLSVPSASAMGLHGAEVAQYNRCAVARTADGWTVDIESRGYDSTLDRFTALGQRSLKLIRN